MDADETIRETPTAFLRSLMEKALDPDYPTNQPQPTKDQAA